jgi:HK97 family phage portal protein
MWGGRQSSAGVSVSEDDALSLSAIFAGVQLLSSIIGALPLSVYRKDGRSRQVADDEPAHHVLHTEYNPEMTASIGRRTSEFHRLLWGNEYAEIQNDQRGELSALWPLEPWRVQAKRRDSGQLFYLVDGTREVESSDMLHVPLVSKDGVTGRSFVDYALTSLGVGIATQDFSARFFGNGAKPGGLLKHAGSPSKEARKEFRESWQETHGGPENVNRVGVLWGGWDWLAGDGTMELEKAQLLQTKQFQTEEVARWLNIPPHLLRDLSRATFSNIEHQGIDFVIYSLMPPLVNKEQEYDRKLLRRLATARQVYCKHNVAALLRGDSAARAAFYKELWMMGVLSQNDIRELEDMNPIAGGDVYYVPVNMQPIQKAQAAIPDATNPKPPQDTQAQPAADGQPAEDAEDAAATGDVQGTALNGAQIASLILVTDKLAAKQYPADSSKAIIQAAFPLMDEALIDTIVDGLKDFESPAPNEPRPPSPALRPILADVFARLSKKLANEARRAAKKPGQFLAWLDAFFPKFEVTLAQALAPIDDNHAAGIAAAYCATSRELLLDIAGSAKPQELFGLVDLTLDEWAITHPGGWADKALEKIHAKV